MFLNLIKFSLNVYTVPRYNGEKKYCLFLTPWGFHSFILSFIHSTLPGTVVSISVREKKVNYIL